MNTLAFINFLLVKIFPILIHQNFPQSKFCFIQYYSRHYCIVTWHKNHFQDFFKLLHSQIRIIHHLIHCYRTVHQIAKKLLFVGQQVCFWQLVGVFTLHMHAWSPNLTIKMLVSRETRTMWCISIKGFMVTCSYGLVNT